MRYCSTRSNAQNGWTIGQALQKGLGDDAGLIIPEHLPVIDQSIFDQNMYFPEFAYWLLQPFFQEDPVLESRLWAICHEAFNFSVPLIELADGIGVLELFHGPTLSFKDFGARFLASCLSRLAQDRTMTIMVATSGDTGSAVASAFYQQPNINVMILFPEGKISKRQKQQIACWNRNILPVAVKGNFDQCQSLIKSAFSHTWWQENAFLNTSNSINIGRLLPQMSYYAYTSWHYYHQTGFQLNFIVPSGNLGNVTACFWAKKAGFPINRIYISQNDNDTLLQYLQTGNDPSQTSQATLANAMDVGKPSNFERLKHLFKDFETFKNNVEVVAASDEKIKQAVYEVYKHYNYLMCPHTATTYHANKTFNVHHVAYVATAHPAKFDHIIKNILDREIEAPQQLEKLLNAPDHSKSINPDMNELINIFKMLQS